MPRKHGMFRSALSGFSSGARLARRVAPYVKSGIKMFRKFRSGGSSGPAKKARKVVGQTTFQEDYRSLYNRRRAPRRVRNRARRSFQRFTYLLDKTQGMTSSVINNFASGTTSPTSPLTGSQAVYGIGMYGTSASLSAGDFNSDLYKIYDDASGATPTSSNAAMTLRFRACIMDFVVKNTGSNPMFLEVYQCVARKDGASCDASAEWQTAFSAETSGTVGTALTSITSYKVTPFDAPGFGIYWYVKSRKRFYISAGNTVAWQVRDPKNYVIKGEEILKATTLKNRTEACILVAYGADVVSWSSVSMGQSASIGVPTSCAFDINCIKTYHWTYTSLSTDNVGYADYS